MALLVLVCEVGLGDWDDGEGFADDVDHAGADPEAGVEDLEAHYLEEGEDAGEDEGGGDEVGDGFGVEVGAGSSSNEKGGSYNWECQSCY